MSSSLILLAWLLQSRGQAIKTCGERSRTIAALHCKARLRGLNSADEVPVLSEAKDRLCREVVQFSTAVSTAFAKALFSCQINSFVMLALPLTCPERANQTYHAVEVNGSEVV